MCWEMIQMVGFISITSSEVTYLAVFYEYMHFDCYFILYNLQFGHFNFIFLKVGTPCSL